MIFKLLTKIDCIKKIRILNERVFLLKENASYELTNLSLTQFTDVKTFNILTYQKSLIPVDSRNLPINDWEIPLELENKRLLGCQGKYFLYYLKNPSRYGFINTKDNSINELEKGFKIIFKDFVIGNLSNVLYAISLQTEKELWNHTLPEKYNWKSGLGNKHERQFDKVIGVYNEKLFVVLNSGIIQIIDVNNGRLIDELIHAKNQNEILPIEKGFERVNIFNCYSVFDNQGKIFGTKSKYYWEIDITNHEFLLYDCTETCNEHQMELDKIAGFEGDEVYFYDGGSNNKFGVFSRSKKEIIWSSEIEETKGLFPAIRDMQYANNKIFVLDLHNTLHIFEQEPTENNTA